MKPASADPVRCHQDSASIVIGQIEYMEYANGIASALVGAGIGIESSRVDRLERSDEAKAEAEVPYDREYLTRLCSDA